MQCDPASERRAALADEFKIILKTFADEPTHCTWHLGECSETAIREISQEFEKLLPRDRYDRLMHLLQRFYRHCVLSDCRIAINCYRDLCAKKQSVVSKSLGYLLAFPAYRQKEFSFVDKWRKSDAARVDVLKMIAFDEFTKSYKSLDAEIRRGMGPRDVLSLADIGLQLDILFLRYHCQLKVLDEKANAIGYLATTVKVAANFLGKGDVTEPEEGLEYKPLSENGPVSYAFNRGSSGWGGGLLPSETCGWIRVACDRENILFFPFDIRPEKQEPIAPQAMMDLRELISKRMTLALSSVEQTERVTTVARQIYKDLQKCIPNSAYPSRALTTIKTDPYLKTILPPDGSEFLEMLEQNWAEAYHK